MTSNSPEVSRAAPYKMSLHDTAMVQEYAPANSRKQLCHFTEVYLR